MREAKINKFEAMQAREAGETYTSIAERYGVSRQAVFTALKAMRKRPRIGIPGDCIYPNLTDVMEQGRVYVRDLCAHIALSEAQLRYRMKGNRDFSPEEQAEILMALSFLAPAQVGFISSDNLFQKDIDKSVTSM